MLGRFVAWGLGLTALSFVLEPSGHDRVPDVPEVRAGRRGDEPVALRDLAGAVGDHRSPRSRSRPCCWRGRASAGSWRCCFRCSRRRACTCTNSHRCSPSVVFRRVRATTRLPATWHLPSSLTIVLPAYNEAERIGPALDELFGYLEHRNPVGRDGAPGAAALPESIEVLVVDDGSSDGTADLVRARPETTPNAGVRDDAAGARRAPRRARAPRCAPGCSPRSRTSSSSPTPTWRRRPTSSRCSSRPSRRTTWRSARGSSRTARTCARRSRGTGGCSGKAFHLLASIWVVGPVKDTQCGFKGFRRDGRPRPVRAPADHEHRVRRRADLPGSQARLLARGHPDPLGRQARLADARPVRSRASAWRGTCSASRWSTGASAGSRRASDPMTRA